MYCARAFPWHSLFEFGPPFPPLPRRQIPWPASARAAFEWFRWTVPLTWVLLLSITALGGWVLLWVLVGPGDARGQNKLSRIVPGDASPPSPRPITPLHAAVAACGKVVSGAHPELLLCCVRE